MATAVMNPKEPKLGIVSETRDPTALDMFGRPKGTVIAGAVLGLLSWLAVGTFFYFI